VQGARKMPKKNIPNYRLHKASGQAFVELGGRRFYQKRYRASWNDFIKDKKKAA
jgi:hypothetical protein